MRPTSHTTKQDYVMSTIKNFFGRMTSIHTQKVMQDEEKAMRTARKIR